MNKLNEYTLWQRFSNVIKKSMENCKKSNNIVLDHFISADKIVQIGSNYFKVDKRKIYLTIFFYMKQLKL